MSKKLPNILILMPDQMRADCMGCAGHPVIRTPNMDRLAAEGVRFSQATTVCPICMPARASFINGLYPHNHHMWQNAGRMPADDETVFHHLHRMGYCSAHIGKSHYYPHGKDHLRSCESYMHARGLEYVHETTGPHATVTTDSYMTDHWAKQGLLQAFRNDYRGRAGHNGVAVWPSPLPTEEYLDSYVGRRAVEFLDSYHEERPFCLFVGFPGPHEPWDAPGEYATMYDPDDVPPAIVPQKPQEWLTEHALAWMEEGRRKNLTGEQIARVRANYYGKISLVDYWFGEILSAFERRGWLGDAIVVFWSDHGEMAGDHQRLHKSVFYESSVRVPLILRWPGRIEGGRACDSPAQIIDVFPTLLEAIGAEPSQRCLGRSLWPSLCDPAAKHRYAAFSEIARDGRRHFMVRTAEYKYAMDDTGEGNMLFCLTTDPNEQNNLIGHSQYVQAEEELRDRLLRFLCNAQFQI